MLSIRELSGVVNTAVVIAAAEGIVMNKNSNLLSCNGGGILLTKDWAKHLLKHMGMVKQRQTQKRMLLQKILKLQRSGFCWTLRT